MLFHSVTEDVECRNCLAKSCPYCVRNSLLEDQKTFNHIIGYINKQNNEIMMPASSQIATNLSKKPNKFIFEKI